MKHRLMLFLVPDDYCISPYPDTPGVVAISLKPRGARKIEDARNDPKIAHVDLQVVISSEMLWPIVRL